MLKKQSGKFLLGIFLLCLASGLQGKGVENINMARSRFFIDQAVFADSSGNRLEVYYKIFNNGLKYVKKGSKYVGNYEINVIVLGDNNRQVTGKSIERTYLLDSYELTCSEEGFLTNQINLVVEPGKYELICKIIDHNSEDVSTIQSKFVSPRFRRDADLSTIEFARDVEGVTAQGAFTKGNQTVIPAVERSFDNEMQRLVFYVEGYLGAYIGKTITLTYSIENRQGKFDLGDTTFLVTDDGLARLLLFADISDQIPGKYDFLLQLKDGKVNIVDRKSRFIIKWSLSSLIKNDFDYAVRQLRYIITKSEKEALLAVHDSLRQRKFEEWWAEKDPTPNSVDNELRDEYYRRIRYTNQYYSQANREGWLTDRGMIYIRFGEPDQIDRYPFELGRKPYQVWYYYSQRRTFVFEDRYGDGDYQLQYPYDGDWSGRRQP